MIAIDRLRRLVLVLGFVLPGVLVAEETVSIAYVGDAEGQAWKGASMGLDEVNRAGGFLGYTFELTAVDDAADVPEEAIAIVVALDGEESAEISADNPDRAVINSGSASDALRELCRENLFSVMPSERMRADAVTQWQEQADDAGITAVAHHHTFRRYSSGDLNGRFTDTYDENMSEEAWTAYVAVRLVGDAVTRTTSVERSAVIEHLHGLESFDASKGQPLSFRDTGQLRQPLWIVQDDRVLGEAPVEGVVDPDDLDTLGLTACPNK